MTTHHTSGAPDAPAAPHAPDRHAIRPGQGRAGCRAADLVALLLPLVLLIPVPLLVRAGLVPAELVFLNITTPLLSLLVLAYAPMCWHAEPSADGLLATRTLTGRRTVDLTRLTKVGRYEAVSDGPVDDRLILTDAHGVRVIVNKLKGGRDTVDATVRDALLRHPSDTGVIVSARAAERLDLESQVARPDSRLKPGRRIPENLTAWAPLILGALVCVPLGLGLTLVGYLLAGSP